MLILFLWIKICGRAARLGHRLFFSIFDLEWGRHVPVLAWVIAAVLGLWGVIWILYLIGGDR
jgi:hypothetical protein